MIQRRKDYSKKAPSKDASKIYIICEGKETETAYFEFFEGLSSNLQLIVIPPEDGQTDPRKLMEQAKRLFLEDAGKYNFDYLQKDQIWFAIDTDAWEKEDKIRPLREFCNNQNKTLESLDERKPYRAWNVAQSNPCFEIWLYYHFYDTPPHEYDIMNHPSMKSFVDSRISGGFNFQKDPVRLKDAINNSERNFQRQENGNPTLFSTEQPYLGHEILQFVHSELAKLRNKLS